jgi:hypothetical protein
MTGLHDQDKLARTRGQIFFKESVSQRVKVRPGNAMASIWILHKPELLVEVYQLVEQALRALKMNVVVACAVNDEQFALQTTCEINWGTVLVTHSYRANPYSAPGKSSRATSSGTGAPATPL